MILRTKSTPSLIPRSLSNRCAAARMGSAHNAARQGKSPTRVPLPRSCSPLVHQQNVHGAPGIGGAVGMVRAKHQPNCTNSKPSRPPRVPKCQSASSNATCRRSNSPQHGYSARSRSPPAGDSAPCSEQARPLSLCRVQCSARPMRHWLPPPPIARPTGATQPRDVMPDIHPLPPPPVPLHNGNSGVRLNVLARPAHASLALQVAAQHPDAAVCAGAVDRAAARLGIEQVRRR